MEVTELKALCETLDALSKPEVDNMTRFESLRLYESYKSNDRCADIGFCLLNFQSLSPNVRHYGLLLIKHRIRMCWTIMNSKERAAVKSQLLTAISTCPNNEHFYIKTTLAGVLNELVKHVWPQSWPAMHDEVINHCCVKGTLGTKEIIVSMFQNLAEDVVLFESIENKSRERNLRKALLSLSADIVKFLVKLVQEHAALANGDRSVSAVHLVELALTALEAYVGWIKPELFFLEKGLLETLFVLIESEMYQVVAAQCLLIVASRKGPAVERKLLLQLTDDFFVEKIASAVRVASGLEDFNQARLLFLRILGNIVSALNSLLISVWDDKTFKWSTNELRSKKSFLELVFYLSTHESKCVAYTVSHCWTRLLQHKEARNDPTLRQVLPRLVDFASQNICKDFAKKTVYSRFEERDLNDNEELDLILQNFRANMVELLRYCTLVLPIETIKKCYEYTEYQLNAKYASEEEKSERFEGVLTFLETVSGSVVRAAESHGQTQLLPVEFCENLLQSFLSQKTDDPTTLQLFLSCATALCKVIVFSSNPTHYFKLLIDYIFHLLDKTSDSDKRIQFSFHKLRTHVCVTPIHLAKLFSNVLIHLADYFNSRIQEKLNKTPCNLSPTEEVALLDALVIICMEWGDISRQNLLLSDIMKRTLPIIRSPEFLNSLNSPKDFAYAIGIGIVPLDEVDGRQLPSAKLRSDIIYHTSLTLVVFNRTQSRKSGKETDSSAINPCSAYARGVFGHIVNLTHVLAAMWSPASHEFIHPENLNALGLKGHIKIELLSHSKVRTVFEKHITEETPKIHWEHLQTFLIDRLDCCYRILGLIAGTLSPSFFRAEGLQQLIAFKILSNIEFLCPMRLKTLSRQFLNPFFKYCPEELAADVLSPLLQKYCLCMMNKLQTAWQAYKQKEPNELQSSAADNEKEEQEILEEEILLSLTREYFDLLISLCILKPSSSRAKKLSQNCVSDDTVDDVSVKFVDGDRQLAQLSSLGIAIANSPSCENVLLSALISLTWQDSTSCCKATQLLFPLLKRLTVNQCDLFNEEITQFVLTAIMYGLKRHGENASCESRLSSLALMIIQALKPQHEQTIISIIQSTMQKRNEKGVRLFLSEFDTYNKKQKKSSFKKLVSEGIDLRVVEQLKVIPEMEVFASLFARRRRRMEVEETSDGMI